ncbi:MAG: ribosome recycling factor [Bacteroidales bacterium]
MDVKLHINASEEKMKQAIAHLDESLAHIRAGKANTRIIDGVMVEYYGSHVQISNVATVSTPDAKTITITPWERPMIQVIERALMNSEVGITPENNGEMIILRIPPLTEERRKSLVKQSKEEAERAKVSVRNARRDANDALKKMIKDGLPEDMEKDAEAQVQKKHDIYIKQVDDLYSAKEREIMTV